MLNKQGNYLKILIGSDKIIKHFKVSFYVDEDIHLRERESSSRRRWVRVSGLITNCISFLHISINEDLLISDNLSNDATRENLRQVSIISMKSLCMNLSQGGGKINLPSFTMLSSGKFMREAFTFEGSTLELSSSTQTQSLLINFKGGVGRRNYIKSEILNSSS